MSRSDEPILVTGAHCSGTTWVGETLARAPGTGYLWEPYNVDGLPGVRVPGLRFWYRHVPPSGHPQIAAHLRALLEFRYPFREALRQSGSVGDIGRSLREAARFAFHRFRGDRPILKDPLASFSAPWIAEEFEAEVVALVRHPAALAGSLKVREWTHPFSHFTAQRSLMEGPLEPFVERLEGAADDPPGIVEQAILLWNCVYSFLARAAREHERIRLVRHEDVARNPHRSFEALFDGLGLDYPQDVDDYVTDQTAPSNSVISDDPGSTARDSRRVVWTWRHRLTDNEIRRVREGTARTASHFYGESDWRPPENLRPGTWEGEH